VIGLHPELLFVKVCGEYAEEDCKQGAETRKGE